MVRGKLHKESDNPGPPMSGLIERMSGPRSRAWEVTDRATEMDRNGDDIIHLGVGDPDFDSPKGVVDAAIAALRSGRTHYPAIAGEPGLKSAVAHAASAQYGVAIDSRQVTVFPGAQCALFAAMLCLSGPDDEVILLEPFYATYEGVAQAGGASVVSVPMPAQNRFEPDIESITNAVTDKTRVILANSPGNPSGAVFSEAEWNALLRLCRADNIWLISDEVYSSFVFDGRHCCPMSLPAGSGNVVVVNSVSKSHAMTGWRLGWTVSPPELSAQLAVLAQALLFGVSQFTQDAAIVALSQSHPELPIMQQAFRARRNLLCDGLEATEGLIVHRPAGGMFVLVDVSSLGCDGERFANSLLDYGGVAVVPGVAFGDSMKNYVRIGYLVDESKLRVAVQRISKFVREKAYL